MKGKKVKPTGPTRKDEAIRLNRYVANSGVCSRREADQLIAKGKVSVNGKVVTEMGIKVTLNDKVEYEGRVLSSEKKVYVLLNKPKGYVTTLKDPQGRRTVLELVKNICRERIYPVGRLDTQTTGLLLFTNDGDLSARLTHPKYEVEKIYKAVLDKNLNPKDFEKISTGIELEDGPIKVDELSYLEKKNEIGLKIHSGRNRIVRRIFESLGYDVERLDRVLFAGLNKKMLPRGKARMLTDQEVGQLKMLGAVKK